MSSWGSHLKKNKTALGKKVKAKDTTLIEKAKPKAAKPKAAAKDAAGKQADGLSNHPACCGAAQLTFPLLATGRAHV